MVMINGKDYPPGRYNYNKTTGQVTRIPDNVPSSPAPAQELKLQPGKQYQLVGSQLIPENSRVGQYSRDSYPDPQRPGSVLTSLNLSGNKSSRPKTTPHFEDHQLELQWLERELYYDTYDYNANKKALEDHNKELDRYRHGIQVQITASVSRLGQLRERESKAMAWYKYWGANKLGPEERVKKQRITEQLAQDVTQIRSIEEDQRKWQKELNYVSPLAVQIGNNIQIYGAAIQKRKIQLAECQAKIRQAAIQDEEETQRRDDKRERAWAKDHDKRAKALAKAAGKVKITEEPSKAVVKTSSAVVRPSSSAKPKSTKPSSTKPSFSKPAPSGGGRRRD